MAAPSLGHPGRALLRLPPYRQGRKTGRNQWLSRSYTSAFIGAWLPARDQGLQQEEKKADMGSSEKMK
jgi:hypothetical protein